MCPLREWRQGPLTLHYSCDPLLTVGVAFRHEFQEGHTVHVLQSSSRLTLSCHLF